MNTARRTNFRADDARWRRRRAREESSRSSDFSSSSGNRESWIPTVPSWEKRFCTSVCRVPWKKICETKRMMSLYSNIAEWDDSAGKEAFETAKARFYAEINGLPCRVCSPGPDIFIDKIDWNPDIDHQLVVELEHAKNQQYQISSSTGSGWDKNIPCSGWEDDDDANIDPWEKGVKQMQRERESKWQAPWRLEDCFLKVVDTTCQVEEQKNLRDDDANMDPWEEGVRQMQRARESDWHANTDPWEQGVRQMQRERESEWHANTDPWEQGVRQMQRERESEWHAPWRLEDCFHKIVDKTCEVEGQKNSRDDHHHQQGNGYQRRRRQR